MMIVMCSNWLPPMPLATRHPSTASPLTRAQDFYGSWERGGHAEPMGQLRRHASSLPTTGGAESNLL